MDISLRRLILAGVIELQAGMIAEGETLPGGGSSLSSRHRAGRKQSVWALRFSAHTGCEKRAHGGSRRIGARMLAFRRQTAVPAAPRLRVREGRRQAKSARSAAGP